MNYENFGEITKRHRVIHQNWPVGTFCSPTRLTVLEVQTLHAVLHSLDPPPLFRKLSDAEWTLFEAAVASGTDFSVPPSSTTVNAPHLPPPRLLLPGPSNLTSTSQHATVNGGTTTPPRDPSHSLDRDRDPGPSPNTSASHSGDTNSSRPITPVESVPTSGTLVSIDGGLTLVSVKARNLRWDSGMSLEEKAARKVEIEAEKAAKKAAKKAAVEAKKAAKKAATEVRRVRNG